MSQAPRWIISGDSIHASVYCDDGVGDSSKLMSARLPALVNISVHNISSPGQRMTEGGSTGFGAFANKNAIGTIVGYSGVDGILITVGTNDWANPGTSIHEYIATYKAYIQYCRGLPTPLPVVVLSPIWRADHEIAIRHSDGWSWTLEHWRYFTESLAYEEAVKPGTFVTVISGNDAPLLSEHFVNDQIHLNASGHEVMTNWLITRMQAHGYWL